MRCLLNLQFLSWSAMESSNLNSSTQILCLHQGPSSSSKSLANLRKEKRGFGIPHQGRSDALLFLLGRLLHARPHQCFVHLVSLLASRASATFPAPSRLKSTSSTTACETPSRRVHYECHNSPLLVLSLHAKFIVDDSLPSAKLE